jgi:hypothetical protein
LKPPYTSYRAASVGNRAPPHGGEASRGVLSSASDDDGGTHRAMREQPKKQSYERRSFCSQLKKQSCERPSCEQLIDEKGRDVG